jgi:hypothetical protein
MLFQRELLPVALEVIPGTINLWMWHQMMLMLIIMAVNRFEILFLRKKCRNLISFSDTSLFAISTGMCRFSRREHQ